MQIRVTVAQIFTKKKWKKELTQLFATRSACFSFSLSSFFSSCIVRESRPFLFRLMDAISPNGTAWMDGHFIGDVTAKHSTQNLFLFFFQKKRGQ
jgi:hypothetical protein